MENPKVLRILILIPNLGRGGAQGVFWQQMNHLTRHFEVVGCVFNWDDAFEKDKLGNIVSLEVPGGKNWIDKAYYFIIRILRLRKLKREKKIDISISHLEGADYVNLLSRNSDKVICWIHGTKRFDENINGLLGLIRQYILMPTIYRRAQRIVTVSRGIHQEFMHSFNGVESVLETIYNGFDVDHIQDLSLEMVDENFVSLCKTSSVIITHCRLSRQKNLTALVHIFKKVIAVTPSKLVILGDGELRDAIVEECKNAQLKTWTCWKDLPWTGSYDVYFLGQQQNPFKFLRHAHLYSLTSGWEGFPLALCEAMAIGLPIIAADCFTGPREIIAPEIDLPQPIQSPIYTPYGTLMPLANSLDSLALGQWTDETVKIISGIGAKSIRPSASIDRIKVFSLSETMNQTVGLIDKVSRINS